VRKSGAWYTYDGDQLGQGKENSRRYLTENPAVAKEIEDKILHKLGLTPEAKAAKAAQAAADAAAAAEAKAAGEAGVSQLAPKLADRKGA
jgi:recombination protein RecA